MTTKTSRSLLQYGCGCPEEGSLKVYRRLRQTIAALATMLAAAISQAQETHYLEMVVFHRPPQAAQTVQAYTPAPPVVIPAQFTSLGGEADVQSDQGEVGRIPTGSLQRLEKAVAQLEKRDGYRLLYSTSWRQQLSPEQNKAFPLRVRGLERAPGVYELDGTITLRQDRFLQAQIDLGFTELAVIPNLPVTDYSAAEDLFQSPDSAVAEAAQETVRKLMAQDGLSEWEVTSSYRLKVNTSLESGEINYLDHPFLGVLLYVEPIKPE